MPLAAAVTEQLYTGDGVSTGPYVLSAEIETATDLVVTLDGVVTSAYTITGVGNDAGVSVTFDTAPGNGVEIVLARVAPYDRTRYDYQLGNFKPDTVDADVDRVVMLVQQLATTLLRVPQLPRGKTSLNLRLTPEANKLIGWSADALSLVNLTPATITPAALVFTAIGQLLAVAATQAAGRSAIGAMSSADVNAQVALISSGANLVINGDFSINARRRHGPPQVALTLASGTLVCDRWFVRSLSAPSGTIEASTEVPSGGSRYALRLERVLGTYAGTLAAEQIIQHDETRSIQGRQVTVSFSAKKGTAFSGSGVRVSLISGTAAQGHANLVAGTWPGIATQGTVTITAAALSTTAWTRGSFTVTLPNNVLALAVRLEVQGLTGSALGNDFVQFTEVQLEEGGVATLFERLPLPDQRLRCEAFYETSYTDAEGPGAASTGGWLIMRASSTGGVLEQLNWRYRTPKVGTPTVTFYSSVTGAAANVRDTTAGADVAVTGSAGASALVTTGAPIIAAAVSGRLYEAHFTADAEYY